jgi:regulatory protein
VSGGVRDEVVEGLIDQGYLDDERYARRFAEDRRQLDGWGSERIARRLEAAGIAPEICDRALAQAPGSDLEAAVALLGRRLRVPPGDDGARRRALELLVRKGYELDLAYEAVRSFERRAAA